METGDLYSEAGSARFAGEGPHGGAMDVEEPESSARPGGREESDEEDESAEDDLPLLMRAWVNERNAPELLHYEGTAVENLMELVDFQTKQIAAQPAVVANILKMDVDRVKYLVRSYLRARLAKIELHAVHYTRDPLYRERMSQNELDYAKGFVALGEKHMRRSFLDQLPPHLRSLDETAGNGMEMVTKPDVDTAVFCRVRSTVGEFQFDPSEDPIVMRRNNIFITRYSIIRSLLEDGKVELI